jgi:hypothetical protein
MIIQSSTIADSENYQFTVFTRSESTILASIGIFQSVDCDFSQYHLKLMCTTTI